MTKNREKLDSTINDLEEYPTIQRGVALVNCKYRAGVY